MQRRFLNFNELLRTSRHCVNTTLGNFAWNNLNFQNGWMLFSLMQNNCAVRFHVAPGRQDCCDVVAVVDVRVGRIQAFKHATGSLKCCRKYFKRCSFYLLSRVNPINTFLESNFSISLLWFFYRSTAIYSV